jgi:hypothetical protein
MDSIDKDSIDKGSIVKDSIDKDSIDKDSIDTMAILIEMLSLTIDNFYREHAGDELRPHPTREKAKVERVRQELRKQELRKKVAPRSSAPIASSLDIRQRANGSAEVRIDHGKPIRLSKIPTELLTILASGDSGEDGLVHWKTPDEIGRRLGSRLHRGFKRKTLNHKIYLLREALADGGADRWLVQRDSIKGYRFALRREAPKGVDGLVRSH